MMLFPGSGPTNMILSCKTVGISTDFDATVLRGDPATRRFSVIYLRAGKGCGARLCEYDQGLCAGPRAGAGRSADRS